MRTNMKKFSVLLFAVALSAMAFGGKGINSWFSAEIGEVGGSYNGCWLTNDVESVTEPVFSEGKVVLEDVDVSAPVVFHANESRNAAEGRIDIGTSVLFEGYDAISESDAGDKIFYAMWEYEPTDWPEDPETFAGLPVCDAFGITGDLADADAAKIATWAKEQGVAYSERTSAILADAFLLDCANEQSEIDAEAAKFKIIGITQDGDEWVITVTGGKGDGADYANGKIVIYGASALDDDAEWRKLGEAEAPKFFKAKLEVKAYNEN